MKRPAALGISMVAAVALATLSLARHLQLAVLTPSEIVVKRFRPPPPPDESCAQVERALERSSGRKPVRNTNPFSADEVAIYRSILESWDPDSRDLLNLSDRTSPIDRDFSDCECLKGMEPQTVVSAAHSFHLLTGGVLGRKNIRLVDGSTQMVTVRSNDPAGSLREDGPIESAVNLAFSTGLFTMSEIAFDKEHRRALVSYSFVCGSLCGSGGIWRFEKVDGLWKQSERTCGGWVS